MPRKQPLRAVKPGEKPVAAKQLKSLIEAAKEGDERAMLVALRTDLAETISASTTPARDKASLSIRIMQINRDIQAIDLRAAEEAARGDEVEVDETFSPEAL